MQHNEVEQRSSAERASKSVYDSANKELIRAVIAGAVAAIVATAGPALSFVAIGLFVLSGFFLLQGALKRYRHNLTCKHIKNQISSDRYVAEIKDNQDEFSTIKEQVQVFLDRRSILQGTLQQVNQKIKELNDEKPSPTDAYGDFCKSLYGSMFKYLALKDAMDGVIQPEKLGGYLYMLNKLNSKEQYSEFEVACLKSVGIEKFLRTDRELNREINKLRGEKKSLTDEEKTNIKDSVQKSFADMVAQYKYWEINVSTPLFQLLDSIEEKASKAPKYTKFLSNFSQSAYELSYLGEAYKHSDHVKFMIVLGKEKEIDLDCSKFWTFKSFVRALKSSIHDLSQDKKIKLCQTYSDHILRLNEAMNPIRVQRGGAAGSNEFDLDHSTNSPSPSPDSNSTKGPAKPFLFHD
jgi:hypothetical protein